MTVNKAPVRQLSSCSAFSLLALFALFFAPTPIAQAQTLRFAPAIYGIDSVNGIGVATIMRSPSAIATDVFGNIYVADTNTGIIRKVDPTGTAKIFAGTGGYEINGNNGDNGPAAAAVLSLITSIATDPAGNLYITDSQNFAVRKVNKAGIITTYAGGNGSGSTGDGGAATSAQIAPGALATDTHGNLYIVDLVCKCVRVVTTSGTIATIAGGGTNLNAGQAIAAQFNDPEGLATDTSGNLYIADYGNAKVLKVDPLGAITTFAGTTYGYTGDGGLATNAQLRNPVGVATDLFGNVFISDFFSYVVRKVNSAGIISTVAGSTESTIAFDDGYPADFVQMAKPRGIATDTHGNLYITVPEMDRAYEVVMHPEVFPQTLIGNTSASQRLILENYGDTDVTISPGTPVTFSGDFHRADYSTSGVQCSPNIPLGAHAINWCTVDVVFTPTAEGIRSFPVSIATDSGTVTQTVTSTGLGGALAMNTGQLFIIGGDHLTDGNRGEGGLATAAEIETLYDLVVDSSNNVYFSEFGNCQIRRIDGKTGILTTIAGTPTAPVHCGFEALVGDGGPATQAILPGVGNLTLDAHNNLYIADGEDGRIRKIDLTTGTISTFAGVGIATLPLVSCGYTPDGGLATHAALCGPQNMKFDKDGNLFFIESENEIVRKIDTAGILTTVAGNHALGAGFSGDGGPATAAQLSHPEGLTIDPAGNLIIADTLNEVIRKVDALTGIITTIAGQHGVQAYTGDGLLAKDATMSYPMGLSVDAAGDLFVADRNNSVIRKIDTSGYITTVAGNLNIGDGYNGDRLEATATTLSFAQNIFVGPSGALYIADNDNQLIRELTPNGMLHFPAQKVGTTSNSKSVTMSNVGNRPLNFDSQNPTGITSEFALTSGGTCDFTTALGVGASCTANIVFSPSAAGPQYGTLSFYDDGPATPHLVALSGTGTAQQAQTILWSNLTPHTYGDPSFNLAAVATSGLPVTYSVQSGNATLVGSTLTITGAGAIVLVANQSGDDSWLAAPSVTRSFTVSPVTLNVTAQNKTSEAGQPLQALTFVITGFINNDQPSVVTGTPSLSTTATPDSITNFPIDVAIGTLSAANYTFNLVPAIYSVTPPPRVPDGVVKLITTSTITKTDGIFHVTVTVTNNGTATAQNVVLTSAKLNAVSGSPTPQSLGNIPAGGFATARTSFSPGIAASGTAVVEQVVGTYTGGTFGGSYRATMP